MTIFNDNRELLVSFRNGERAAMRLVYDHYKRKVENVVRQGAFLGSGRFAGAPRAECIDLVQETFIRAFGESARHSFSGVGDYEPFLMGICRHVLAEWWRRRGREVHDDQVIEQLPAAAPAESPFDPRELEQTRAYIDALPADLQKIYERRFLEGCSQLDTAAHLGLGRQTVRTLEQRLLKGLRKWLQKKIS